MSTRAIIAVEKDGQPWQGVYHHYDGYPSWLGREIYNAIQTDAEMNDISMREATYRFVMKTITAHKGGWAVLHERCFCHDADNTVRHEPDMCLTRATADPLHHEFVYVLDPEKLTMTVLASYYSNSKSEYDYFTGAVIPMKQDENPPWDYIEDNIRREAEQRSEA